MITDRLIILFDGVCNLCNSSVDFILKKDRKGAFIFASIQSEQGKKVIAELGLEELCVKSVALIDDKEVYFQSTAILRILRKLSFPWNVFYLFIIIPRPIRDFFYNIISRNRYEWFGKRDMCRLPTDREKDRFLS